MARDYSKYDKDALIAHIYELEKQLKTYKYGLYWDKSIEQEDVINKCKTNIPVLEREDSLCMLNDADFDTHILIEGDNFHALSALNMMCGNEGYIDIIYIDPPYNTGNKDFTYNDSFVDREDGFRHSKWLSFLNSRIELGRKLLKDSGVIFISIDDNEQAALRMLCDKIFGERNFVSQLVWEKKKKGSFLSNSITNVKEYVLVYAKNINSFNGLIGEITTKKETYPCINATNKREIRHIPKGISSNYKEKNYFLPKGTEISDTTMSIVLHSDLVIKDGVLAEDFDVEGNWRYSQEAMEEYATKKELYITRDLYLRRIVNDARYKMMKDILPRVGDDTDATYNTTIDVNNLFDTGWGSNEDADEELRMIFGEQKKFDYPKPVRLIMKLIAAFRNDKAVCLDFFAGSGTTAQAVLELNSLDGGNRKIILCTNNEGNICTEVTYPRVKTVITGKRMDGSDYSDGIPANLMYYKTDFIEDSRNTDQAKYCLVEKLDELLCIIEETYVQKERTDHFSHYESISGEKHTFIYSDYYSDEPFAEFLALVNCYEGEKTVYMFSTDNIIDEQLFEDTEGISVKPIPNKIYEIYKEIVEDIKRGEQ